MDCSTTLADVSRFVSRALDKASSMETVFSEATGLVHASDYIALRYFEAHDSCSVVSTSIAKCNAAELKATFMAYPNSVSKFVSETTIMGRACAWVVTLEVSHNTHLLFMGTDSWDISESTLEIIGAVIRNLLSSFPYDPCYLEKVVREFPEDRLQLISSRGFSIDSLNDDDIYMTLLACGYYLSKDLRIKHDAFARFVYEVRTMYNDVPYHNWLHAADSAQFVFSVFRNANVANCLTKIEMFALFVAAICHDIDHNGLNNAYQRKANTILAFLAPNLPPLETHHADLAVNTLNIHYHNIFDMWSEEDIFHFQKFVVMCILATDMDRHSQFVERFSKARVNFDKENEDNRLLLAQIIMKSADLSNVVRDFQTAAEMTKKLSTEFFLQGDRETQMGLQISPMCDRSKDTDVAGGQIGFYKFVAGPLMHELHSFFPQLADNERQYLSNLDTWTKVKQTP